MIKVNCIIKIHILLLLCDVDKTFTNNFICVEMGFDVVTVQRLD